MGTTLASFQQEGNVPNWNDILNRRDRGKHKDSEHSLSILLLMPSGPEALETFKRCNIFFTSVGVVVMFSRVD